MSCVTITGLRVEYAGHTALDRVNFDVPDGSLVSVLGPSGCGKTTLLRAIAGLLPVAAGEIALGTQTVSSPGVRVPPERRGIGWVPQEASLFPHLSVRDNIGFGLPRNRDRAARIAELAALVGLGDHLDRAPNQLSGGQAQRVSLARALAGQPEVVLLDEPFAALDPMLRIALRAEVSELLRGQHATSLLVTHDQEEALSLSDYILVMMGGRTLQWGTPNDVYERPATPWVARFVGNTSELAGIWQGDSADTPLGRIPATAMEPGLQHGGRSRIVLRPEWIELGEAGTPAVVTGISYAGHDALVSLRLETGELVRSRVNATRLPTVGEQVALTVRHTALAYR